MPDGEASGSSLVFRSERQLKGCLFSFIFPIRVCSIDGRVQFAIKMTPAALCDWALYDGILYIDQETLSFTRVELSLDVSDPVKATRMMLVRRCR